MEREEIFSKLNEIFKDVMDNDDIIVTETTSSDDIDEWDSLSHIQLVVAIEKTFHVKISSIEVRSWDNVGEMVDALQIKLKNC